LVSLHPETSGFPGEDVTERGGAADQPPHFIQIGDAPALIGDGTEVLACGCGQPVLIKGYQPERLVAISIQCSNCGRTTTTPDLPTGKSLTGHIVPVDRSARSMPVPGTIQPGVTLADRTTVERVEAPLRPRKPIAEPLTLSTPLLLDVASDYDRLTGGAYAAHVEAVRPMEWRGVRHHPLAWSCLQLEAWLARPDLPLLGIIETTVAAAHVGAFRQFLTVWGEHPMFPQMVKLAASTGFGLHELAIFATLGAMFEAGNRIGLMQPASGKPRMREWSVQTDDRLLAIETAPFSRFEWPDGKPWSAASVRSALADAVDAARGRINQRNPGILVLSSGLVPESFDMWMQQGMERFFRTSGRSNRGLAALGMIAPRVLTADRVNRFGFGWVFYPVANPMFGGENKVVLGPREST
jgi:hypothetical protein